MMMKRVIPIFALLLATLSAFAVQRNIEQMKAAAERASGGSQARQYAELAKYLVDIADQQFTQGNNEQAHATMQDVVNYSAKARDASIRSHGKLKDTEIILRETQRRGDPKMSAGRGQRIHDLLEDFTAILDEVNDNLDQYQGRPLSKDDRKDFKKGLKEVIEADGKFELKLRTLKSATETDPQMKREASDFQFVLQDAMEALKSNADMAREYMADKESDNTGTTKKK